MSSTTGQTPSFDGSGAQESSDPTKSLPFATTDVAATLQGVVCPACSLPVDPEGDICEHCRAWLKVGQCRFCYQDLPTEASFCIECGSPQAGFDCPKCGQHDYFDFCPGCGDALSEAAAAALNALADDPCLNPASAGVQEAGKSSEATSASPGSLEARPSANLSSRPPPPASPPVRQRLFSRDRLQSFEDARPADVPSWAQPPVDQQTGPQGGEQEERQRQAVLAELAALEQAAQRIGSEAGSPGVHVVARPLQQMLNEIQKRTFANAQDARRFHMALVRRLETEDPRPHKWRCNRFSVLHAGPHLCAAPQFGGVWVPKP